MSLELSLEETQEENKGIDFNKLMLESEVNIDEELERQPIALSIGTHQFKGKAFHTPFGSYGDFSCIVGASKSRKTFLKSALVAGYIGGKANNYFEDITGHDTVEKFILEFDTEQSKFHTQRVLRRVVDMVGHNTEYYKGFSLRKYGAKERQQFIEFVLYESDYKNDIGLVTIDGYADLVQDFNNLEESSKLTDNLLKWTTDKKCHITGVLHRNFGSNKPVGHVGSSILKKAETVVFVDKEEDGEITNVSCKYSRNIEFDDFGFIVNKDTWLPEEVDIKGESKNNW